MSFLSDSDGDCHAILTPGLLEVATRLPGGGVANPEVRREALVSGPLPQHLEEVLTSSLLLLLLKGLLVLRNPLLLPL